MRINVDLTGMKFVVIGATGVVGQAVAHELVNSGARVVGVARRPRPTPPGVQLVTADVHQAALTDIVDQVDGLVYAVDDEHRVLEANLVTALRVAREAPTVMPDGGVVLLLTSMAGLVKDPLDTDYTAANAGLSAALPGLALELSGRGVRVVGLCPSALSQRGAVTVARIAALLLTNELALSGVDLPLASFNPAPWPATTLG